MGFGRIHSWLVVLIVIVTLFGLGAWRFYDHLQYGNASPLHRAVMKGDRERVRRLIGDGVRVDATMKAGLFSNTWGATSLHLAARKDRVEILEDLVKAGANIEAMDELGFTPLQAALQSEADRAAQALLRAGAKVRCQPQPGRAAYALDNCGQPLQGAVNTGSAATVLMLIERGADPRIDIGQDAIAHVNSPDIVPKVQMLLDRGLPINSTIRFGGAIHNAVMRNDVPAVTFLLDRGADIELRRPLDEYTPLIVAVSAGSNDVVKLLIERKADTHAKTSWTSSLIFVAAFSGQRETLRLLLSMNLGIDIQAGRIDDNATPLHFAYWNNDPEMIDMLIKAGARTDARTTDGRLPHEYRKNR